VTVRRSTESEFSGEHEYWAVCWARCETCQSIDCRRGAGEVSEAVIGDGRVVLLAGMTAAAVD